jgi:hypothetical protein
MEVAPNKDNQEKEKRPAHGHEKERNNVRGAEL